MAIDRQLFVVFGGSGDLARRKLIPALHRSLSSDGNADAVVILGIGTKHLTDEEYCALVEKALIESGLDAATAQDWCGHIAYQSIAEGGYPALCERIDSIEVEHELPGNRVFYLALPPSAVGSTVESLGTTGLYRGAGWTRLVIEKPFGHDLVSARELNETIHRYFTEDEVYRIDHYLGKETVRNLLVFRFANSLFERTWNRDHIESVEITVAEKVGVGGRGRYYDESGAVRDMVQNHMTQLLTLVAMEPPVDMAPAAIRMEKTKVLKSITAVSPDDVLVGQVTGYRDLDGIAADSTTATYAALRLSVDNWRWQGVPFLLRTGKQLAKRFTRITIRYRLPPVCLFHADGSCPGHQNLLYITLQPDEGFDLFFDIKEPGDPFTIGQIPLSVRYDDWLGELPDAYHTLLLDVMEGDQTLFVTGDEVEQSWRIYDNVLDPARVEIYEPGGTGPVDADAFAAAAGTTWSAI